MPSDTYCYPLAVSEQIKNMHSSPDLPSDRFRHSLRHRCDPCYMVPNISSGLAGFIAGVMVVYLFFPSLLTFREHGQAFSVSKSSSILTYFDKI